MLVKVYSAAVQGIEAITVTIEVDVIGSSVPSYSLVGSPDSSVRESYDRVRCALAAGKYKFPNGRVVVNMAPADIRKEGAGYDLPQAIAIAAAAGQITDHEERLRKCMFVGELSLDGVIHPCPGILPVAIRAREEGFESLIVPQQNAREAAVVDKLKVYGANNLSQVIRHLNGVEQMEPTEVDTRAEFFSHIEQFDIDYADVKGQDTVKRAFEVAAAGGHNLIMVGPPGAGKSMMAKRIHTILPPLTLHEALETTKIHSVAGQTHQDTTLMTKRPFRSPHHTISDAALIGGGATPKPGEISLAHHGVLFLDELPEFKRQVLEVLRQPLEDRQITISRARQTLTYPASFMLIASMNPCPCGYFNHPTHPCSCTPGAVQRYLGKISGPLLDRIDLQVEITPVPYEKLSEKTQGESSAAIRERVLKARKIQQERYANDGSRIFCNAQMGSAQLRQYAQLNEKCSKMLQQAMQSLSLSARAYDRILKVARTIADLDGSAEINEMHLSESIGYRNLDREGWGT